MMLNDAEGDNNICKCGVDIDSSLEPKRDGINNSVLRAKSTGKLKPTCRCYLKQIQIRLCPL